MLFVFAKKIMHKYLKISCLQKRGGVVGVGNQTFYIIYIINTGYAYEIYIYKEGIIDIYARIYCKRLISHTHHTHHFQSCSC